MATSGIDSTTAGLIIAAAHGGTAVTFAAPIKLLFNSVQRTTDNGADTEWSTSGGYTAGTGATVTYSAVTTGASGASQASNAAATITNAPAGTWAGCTEVDSSGTPKKLFWAALTTPKTVNAGDTVTVPSTSLTASLG